jgi:hypothetical protein
VETLVGEHESHERRPMVVGSVGRRWFQDVQPKTDTGSTAKHQLVEKFVALALA